jgi:hypothetical protein
MIGGRLYGVIKGAFVASAISTSLLGASVLHAGDTTLEMTPVTGSDPMPLEEAQRILTWRADSGGRPLAMQIVNNAAYRTDPGTKKWSIAVPDAFKLSEVKIGFPYLIFSSGDVSFVVSFRNITDISYGHTLGTFTHFFAFRDEARHRAYFIDGWGAAKDKYAAGKALNAIVVATAAAVAKFDAEFPGVVAKYRSSDPKPGPNEDIHRIDVLATNAISDKHFLLADQYFAEGITKNPWWPPFHYNRALVLSELHLYAQAAMELQRYLELVPDASNAKDVQDKIYLWQAKKDLDD